MRGGRARRFVLGAAAVSAASGAMAWVATRPASPGSLMWGALGWGLMTAIGLGAGAWLAVAHGSTGPGFLAAIVAGILGRLAATVGGSVAAAMAGQAPLWAFLTGLGSGFVPLQVYESVFFYREGRRANGRSGPEGGGE
jgi:hypothetical protein